MVELDLAGRWGEGSDTLEGLIGFGALLADAGCDVSPRLANEVPWAHLGDLDQLRAKIAPKLGG